ncbi:hypothetical protein P4C99_04975 [Pontiellaceae bacterium B1224]|nr:hypothetical protein [Pontiellaceae bacterium B1224]
MKRASTHIKPPASDEKEDIKTQTEPLQPVFLMEYRPDRAGRRNLQQRQFPELNFSN